jgi:outer membrane lipoprotein-sorting protein
MWVRALWWVAAGVVGLGPCVVAGQSPDPVELMRRVQRQATAPDEQVQFAMQLINASGQIRERTGTTYERQVGLGGLDEMRLIRFHSPADIKGSGVLTIEHSDRENDQWLYLPAYHATRRISPANRGDRYMGTDFLYEDIMREKVEEYRYRTLTEDTLGGARCLVLEAVAAAEQLARETAYSKKLIWVDAARDLILRTDYYDRDGRFFKRLTVVEVEKVANKYRWLGVRMEDSVRQHTTVVTYHDRKIGAGVPERYFTEQYLKRGQ